MLIDANFIIDLFGAEIVVEFESPNPVMDPVLSAEARDKGIRRADRGASPWWKKQADLAIIETAIRHNGSTFVVDQVQEVLAEWKVPPPPEGRSMGGRIRAAMSKKIIVATGDYQPTAQVKSHRSPTTVYRAGPGAWESVDD